MALPAGKMYNFFIDDNIFFLTDIYKERPASLFDHFYLGTLKKIHDKYGTVFTLNCFFHNYHEPEFDISLFPESYRREFEDNACWLRLAFHAHTEFPPRPYGEAYPEKLKEHYELWEQEMSRIAGPKTLIAPVILHYFDADYPGRHFMRSKGMLLHAARKGEGYWYNAAFDQMEMPVDMFLNLYEADIDRMGRDLTEKLARGQEKFLIGSHEQYAYTRYSRYIPEYFEGVESVCRLLSENGCQPVYYSEVVSLESVCR